MTVMNNIYQNKLNKTNLNQKKLISKSQIKSLKLKVSKNQSKLKKLSEKPKLLDRLDLLLKIKKSKRNH